MFPSEDAACSTANFSLLIMTSFSELPCLDSLQVVCIFPGVLQTRGGNLQRSTKRGKWQEITSGLRASELCLPEQGKKETSEVPVSPSQHSQASPAMGTAQSLSLGRNNRGEVPQKLLVQQHRLAEARFFVSKGILLFLNCLFMQKG